MASAFQRTRLLIRRSISWLPGKGACCLAGMVFWYGVVAVKGRLMPASRRACNASCGSTRRSTDLECFALEDSMLRIVLILLVIAVVVLLVPRLLSHSVTPSVGSDAPQFTLPSQEGAPVSLSDFRGKWVVLYFYPK